MEQEAVPGDDEPSETPTMMEEDPREEKEEVCEDTETPTAMEGGPMEEKEGSNGALEAPVTTMEEKKDRDESLEAPVEGPGEMEEEGESCEAEAREADSATMSTPPASTSEEVVGVATKGDDDVIKEEGEEPGSCEAEARELEVSSFMCCD